MTSQPHDWSAAVTVLEEQLCFIDYVVETTPT